MEITIEQALQQGVAAHKEGKLQEGLANISNYIEKLSKGSRC